MLTRRESEPDSPKVSWLHPRYMAVPVALLWLLVGLLWRPIGDYGVETDFYGDFLPHARQWMAGLPDVLSGYRGPGYYLIVGILDRLGDGFHLAKILSALSLGGSIWLLGGLFENLWGRRPAWAGVLFLAGNTVLMQHAYRAASDMFFFFLFCAALAFTFISRPTLRTWAAAGLFSGLAFLTRYNGVMLLPMVLVALVGLESSLRFRLKSFAMVMGVWLVVTLPWFVFLAVKTGNPFWNLNHILIAEAIYVGDPSLANMAGFQPSVGFSSISEVLLAVPSQVGQVLFGNIPGHFFADWKQLVGWGWGFGAVIGWVGVLVRRPSRRVLVFGLAGLLGFMAMLPVFYNPRFMIPLLPWWAAGFGVGVAGGTKSIGKRFPRLSSTGWPFAFALLVGLVTVVGVWHANTVYRQLEDGVLPTELQGLAQKALNSRFEFSASTPLCARKPHMANNLGVPFISLAGKSGFESIRKSGAYYLLVSPMEAVLYPALVPLIDGHTSPPGLMLVDQVPGGTLYSVENPVPRPESPPLWQQEVSTPWPGLSRMDFLRLRLARWYTRWVPDRRVSPLLEKVSAQGQNLPYIKMRRGDAFLAEGQIEEARTWYSDLENLPDLSENVGLRLALLDYLEGDEAGFKNRMEVLVSAGEGGLSRPVKDMVRLAMNLKQDGEYEAAAALFIYVRSLDPMSPVSEDYKQLGYCFLNLRMPRRAEQAFLNALKKDPGDREIEVILANDRRLQY